MGSSTTKCSSVDNDDKRPSQHQTSPTQTSTVRRRLSVTDTNDVQFVYDPAYFYASLVAGAGSGAISSVLCAPLDLIRVRMQVWGDVMASTTKNNNKQGSRGTTKVIPTMIKDTWNREGFRGFFRGLGATLLTVPMFWGVYFPLYEQFKHRWELSYSNNTDTTTNKVHSSLIHMGSAVGAGIVADIICNPMFVVRTRLQTEALHDVALGVAVHRPTSIVSTAQSLFREGGLPIFWRGMSANLLGLSHVAIQFPVYERLKQRLRGNKAEESVTDLLLATSLSKMSASLVSYPHEVIRSRMMDARTNVGFWKTCSKIYGKEGMIGFYTGLQVTIIRVIPNTCVTFLSYELLLRWAKGHIEDSRRQNGYYQ